MLSLSRCIKASLQKDPSVPRGSCWRDDSAGHNVTKLIQKAEEPFSDFVARMVKAAGRLFDEPDAMMPMLKLLIFEQATKECRDAITPHKTKGLESWVRVCREVGGLLSNSC